LEKFHKDKQKINRLIDY